RAELRAEDDRRPGQAGRAAADRGAAGRRLGHHDPSGRARVLGPVERDQEVVYELHEERHAWVQVARGSLTLNGQPLWQGDGAAVSAEPALQLIGLESTEVLVFDLG